MDLLSCILGFIAGVFTSVIASFLFRWFDMDVPLIKQKRMMAFIRNPIRYIRMRLDTDERKITELIERLFRAWEMKDLLTYSSCWADGALRIIGTQSPINEDKSQIVKNFESSCQRYSSIKVAGLVFDKITIGPRQGMAIVNVHYRFELSRTSDGLPILEDSQEVYSVKYRNDCWQIVSNIDHFYEIGPRKG
jgi:hypothetical protein